MIMITGATSGIGLEIAKRYHNLNKKLILIGRKAKEELSDPVLLHNTYLQYDLSEPESVNKIVKWIEEKNIKLDILIHNAANAYYGNFKNQDDSNINEIMNVNVITPIKLTKNLINNFNQNGKIVFISSIAAFLSSPYLAVYAASKAALKSFSESIRLELAKNTDVLCICPSGTKTNFHKKAGAPKQHLVDSNLMEPEMLSYEIIDHIKKSTGTVIIGKKAKKIIFASKLFPKMIDKFIIKRENHFMEKTT